MGLPLFNIFHFVEASFLLAILINLISYAAGFYLILSKKRGKTFFRTLKEGWSSRYITLNILNLSLLITTVTMFWVLFLYGSRVEPISFQLAWSISIPFFLFILISCIAYIVYSVYVSLQNFKKFKDLSLALGLLSLWKGFDGFIQNIGGGVLLQPVSDISLFLRKNIIKSQMGEVVLTSLIWMILEYAYKLCIVGALVFLHLNRA